MRRLAIALTACFAFALVLAGPASANKRVIGKTTYYVQQSSGWFLDPAIVTSRRVRQPERGSLSAKVVAHNEDPAFDNLIYVSGLIQCVKRGQEYALGKTYRKKASPFVLRKIPFPAGVRRPRSCRVQASSGFDPSNPPVFPATGPYGEITIKIFWKTG